MRNMWFPTSNGMDPEEKELLEKSVEIAEENNEILKKMQRSMRWTRIMYTVYWLFIIGSAVGAYYLIQPYINAITGTYGGAKSNFSSMMDSFNSLNQ